MFNIFKRKTTIVAVIRRNVNYKLEDGTNIKETIVAEFLEEVTGNHRRTIRIAAIGYHCKKNEIDLQLKEQYSEWIAKYATIKDCKSRYSWDNIILVDPALSLTPVVAHENILEFKKK
jgi:hypothetical protein